MLPPSQNLGTRLAADLTMPSCILINIQIAAAVVVVVVHPSNSRDAIKFPFPGHLPKPFRTICGARVPGNLTAGCRAELESGWPYQNRVVEPITCVCVCVGVTNSNRIRKLVEIEGTTSTTGGKIYAKSLPSSTWIGFASDFFCPGNQPLKQANE